MTEFMKDLYIKSLLEDFDWVKTEESLTFENLDRDNSWLIRPELDDDGNLINLIAIHGSYMTDLVHEPNYWAFESMSIGDWAATW